MRHKLLTQLLALLIIVVLLGLATVDPVYGIEEAIEGPCLWKCFLNFFAFFLLPVSFLTLVMVLEFRRRRHSTPPTE